MLRVGRALFYFISFIFKGNVDGVKVVEKRNHQEGCHSVLLVSIQSQIVFLALPFLLAASGEFLYSDL